MTAYSGSMYSVAMFQWVALSMYDSHTMITYLYRQAQLTSAPATTNFEATINMGSAELN